MPKNFTNLHTAIYKKLKADTRYRQLLRGGQNKFNHATVLTYRGHNQLTEHSDQVWGADGDFIAERNSQRYGSPVAIVTIGDNRELLFMRRCSDGRQWKATEKNYS